MPRKPRVEIAGKYHIINRGVERRVVFKDEKDFNYFLKLIAKGCEQFNIVLHNYCLMSNHYHLLIEIKDLTLSKFMRYINSNYAIYFNKKYNRSGHLWQGRFRSWFVTDEGYFYTLMRYIEYNPVKAEIVKEAWLYPFSSYYHFVTRDVPKLLENSWVVKTYKDDIESIRGFFQTEIDLEDIKKLKKASNLVEAPVVDSLFSEESLQEVFKDVEDRKQRNKLIVESYKSGYSQHMIAKVLGISQPAVFGVIKRNMKIK